MSRIAHLIKIGYTLNLRIVENSYIYIFAVSVVVRPTLKDRDAWILIVLQMLKTRISN